MLLSPDLKSAAVLKGAKTFMNHLDGYNFKRSSRARSPKRRAAPRREFIYFSDNADLIALPYDEWKSSFKTIAGNLFSGKEDSTIARTAPFGRSGRSGPPSKDCLCWAQSSDSRLVEAALSHDVALFVRCHPC